MGEVSVWENTAMQGGKNVNQAKKHHKQKHMEHEHPGWLEEKKAASAPQEKHPPRPWAGEKESPLGKELQKSQGRGGADVFFAKGRLAIRNRRSS